MKVRHPPGRAGRPWLVHRLAVARRGAELLDEKFRALMRERARLEPQVAQARAEWEHRAREAERWLTRAAVMSGERQLALAAAAIARAGVGDRRAGARSSASAAPPTPRSLPATEASLAGGAALLSAAEAHRGRAGAPRCAARWPRARCGASRPSCAPRGCAATRSQRTWIPAHEEALRALELTLEELEREDGARLRRVTQRA